jgi:hypothetical protein
VASDTTNGEEGSAPSHSKAQYHPVPVMVESDRLEVLFLKWMVWRAFLFWPRQLCKLLGSSFSRMKLANKGDETLGGMKPQMSMCAERNYAFAMCACFAGRFVGAHMQCEAASRKKGQGFSQLFCRMFQVSIDY